MKMHEAPENVIDITRIYGVVNKISNDLNAIRGIKAKLTSIGTTSEAIATDMKSLETNIRSSLDELQNILRHDTTADAI
jgi:hypothetical protein